MQCSHPERLPPAHTDRHTSQVVQLITELKPTFREQLHVVLVTWDAITMKGHLLDTQADKVMLLCLTKHVLSKAMTLAFNFRDSIMLCL